MDLSSLSSSPPPPLDPSMASGTTSELAHDNGTVLSVPLEVLERILRYTFLRRTILSPTSDPYPLRGTTHLLLVSKAFRELCIPFFFEHLTIARPSDYITFFDPQEGIFVVGEEGRRRWSFVRALGFGWGVHPPSVFPRVDGESWIVPLRAPGGTRTRTVGFFNKEVQGSTPDGSELQAMDLALADSGTRSRALAEAEEEFHQSPYFTNGGRQMEEWAKLTLGWTLEEEIRDAIQYKAKEAIFDARETFYAKLLHAEPRSHFAFHLSDSAEHLSHLNSVISMMDPPPSASLSFYRNPTPTSADNELLAELFSQFCEVILLGPIRLFGYSTSEKPSFLRGLFEEGGEGSWCFALDSEDRLFVLHEKQLERYQAIDSGRFRRVDKSMELELLGEQGPVG